MSLPTLERFADPATLCGVPDRCTTKAEVSAWSPGPATTPGACRFTRQHWRWWRRSQRSLPLGPPLILRRSLPRLTGWTTGSTAGSTAVRSDRRRTRNLAQERDRSLAPIPPPHPPLRSLRPSRPEQQRAPLRRQVRRAGGVRAQDF